MISVLFVELIVLINSFNCSQVKTQRHYVTKEFKQDYSDMVDDLITSTHNHNAHLPMTSVIISHDIAATLRISDYVAFLEKGKTVVHAPVEEFRKSDHPVIKKFIELST